MHTMQLMSDSAWNFDIYITILMKVKKGKAIPLTGREGP
jgi:hypothetical protein